MSSNIECMSSWELCEYSMKAVREREFVDGLGLENWYKNRRGSVRLQHDTLKQLASRVKERAEKLDKDYKSKQQLQQAMDDELFEDITNPLMESFAHRIWNGSNLSIRPYCRSTRLLYFIEKDQEWIAKNLFCWVCRRFAASFRGKKSTNTQTESIPLSEPPSETTIRGLQPYITRESGKCWIGYSIAVFDDVNPPLDLPTNASSSFDRDRGRNGRATCDSLSSTTESSSELGRKRRRTADSNDGVTDSCDYREPWGLRPDKCSLQLRINTEHESIKRIPISDGDDFIPPRNEENTSILSCTSHEMPPTPKSGGDRSHNNADGAESAIDSAIERCLSPTLSHLLPGSRDYNVSRASLSRAIATVGIPAAEEAIEDTTLPGIPPIASPTTEATSVEEIMGDAVAPNFQVEAATEHIFEPGTPPVVNEDPGNISPPRTTPVAKPITEATAVEKTVGNIAAPHSCPEVAAVETISVQVEHPNSHRLQTTEGKLKTRNRRAEVRLRKVVFNWLHPEEDDDRADTPKRALQLIQAALEEDSQRLNRIWETNFESYYKRLKGWTDFALEIEQLRHTFNYWGARTDLLADEKNLGTDGRHGFKLFQAITNAQEAWYDTHPELEFSDFENGLGLLLRDVVVSDDKLPEFEVLGKWLEDLVQDSNKEIERWLA